MLRFRKVLSRTLFSVIKKKDFVLYYQIMQLVIDPYITKYIIAEYYFFTSLFS